MRGYLRIWFKGGWPLSHSTVKLDRQWVQFYSVTLTYSCSEKLLLFFFLDFPSWFSKIKHIGPPVAENVEEYEYITVDRGVCFFLNKRHNYTYFKRYKWKNFTKGVKYNKWKLTLKYQKLKNVKSQKWNRDLLN